MFHLPGSVGEPDVFPSNKEKKSRTDYRIVSSPPIIPPLNPLFPVVTDPGVQGHVVLVIIEFQMAISPNKDKQQATSPSEQSLSPSVLPIPHSHITDTSDCLVCILLGSGIQREVREGYDLSPMLDNEDGDSNNPLPGLYFRRFGYRSRAWTDFVCGDRSRLEESG
jgi:hypothetical protein